MAKKRPLDDEPTPEELSMLNGGGDDGPSEEELASLEAPARPAAAAPDPEPNILQRAAAAAKGAGRALMAAPGQFKANPRQAGLAAASGMMDASSLGLSRGEFDRLQRMAQPDYQPSMRDRIVGATLGNADTTARIAEQLRLLPPEQRAAALEQIGQSHAEVAQAAEQQPGAALVGAIAAPSPGKLVGLAAGAGRGVSAGRRILGMAAGGAASGALESGGRAALEGKPLGEVAEAAAMGAAVGAPMGAIPAAAVEGSRAAAGKMFPWVGRLAKARDAGHVEHAAELPKGREGVQAAAGEAVDAVRARQAARAADVGQAHGRVVAGAKGRSADLQPVADRLNRVRAGARYEGGDVIRGREGIDNAARDQLNNLYSRNQRNVGDLIEARRAASEAAGFGVQNPTEQQLANREIYRALNDAIEQVAPDVRAADAAVRANKVAEGVENRAVFGRAAGGRTAPSETPGAPPVLDPNDRIRAASRMARIHDPTEPGTKMQAQLEMLAERDPVFAEAIDRIVAKKALEETRFGMPGNGVQLPLHGVAGPGGIAGVVLKNAGAGARVVDDQIARRLQGRASTPTNVLTAARQERERRERERARRLKGQETTP